MKLSYLIHFLRDSDFNPDLPTRLDGQDQTPFEKDGVVERDKPEADEGKSEKTVPVEATTIMSLKNMNLVVAKKSSALRMNDSC